MFFEFGIKDLIDIILVATMLYYIYRLMRESRSLNVFIGILVFIITWLFVSRIMQMRLLGSILDKLVSVGVIVLIVLFQDEIRKFLYKAEVFITIMTAAVIHSPFPPICFLRIKPGRVDKTKPRKPPKYMPNVRNTLPASTFFAMNEGSALQQWVTMTRQNAPSA